MVISSGKSFLSPLAKVDLPEPVPPAIPINIGFAIIILRLCFIWLSITCFFAVVNRNHHQAYRKSVLLVFLFYAYTSVAAGEFYPPRISICDIFLICVLTQTLFLCIIILL